MPNVYGVADLGIRTLHVCLLPRSSVPKSDAEPLSVRTVLEAEQQLAPGISEPLSEAHKLPHATCWSFTLPFCLHIDECNLDAHCTKLDLKRTYLHERLT